MKTSILACTLALSLLSFVNRSAMSAELPSRPNIILLFSDDQRWDTVHALSGGQCQTPVMDRLMGEGFTFRNAYCQGSMIGAVCLPSRTMLATGRSLWRIPKEMRAKQAPAGVPLLPTVMSEAGYVTWHCGKSGNACTFANAAFDTNITLDERVPEISSRMADHAIKFLNGHDSAKPFFMYLAPPVPHDPRVAPQRFHAMYPPSDIKLPKQFMPEHPFDPGILNIRDEKLSAYPRSPDEMKQELSDYYAATTNLDFEFGRVLAALETRGIAKNTIVLVSSDQGLACGGYHALMGKQNLYEDVKPPLFIAGPGIPHGHSDALVYLYDLFPTICDLAGAKTPDVVEGKSLMPVVLGKQPRVRDYLFGAYSDIQRMVRDERWKLYEFHVDGQRHTLLFDLKNDPEELKNLADDPSHAEIRVKLEQQLAAERAAFGDPVVFKD